MHESSTNNRAVRSTRPPAAYIGGKKHLADRIVERIEAVPHDAYIEPCVGMGGVFLRRRWAPRSEVINDINGEVATLFRVLQRHYTAFMDHLRFQVTSRAEFERLAATDAGTLTDIEKAARFLYLQRTAHAGKVVGRNFGVSPGLAGRFNISRLGPLLEEIHERLAGVIIECLPWSTFIERYDAPGTLIYLDPPYFGSEHYYGREAFSRDDFHRMADQLGRIKGRFLLSLNDANAVREIFGAFHIEAIETTWQASGRQERAAELLISGPPGREMPARPADLFSS